MTTARKFTRRYLIPLTLGLAVLCHAQSYAQTEPVWVGSEVFYEPVDGGNLDTAYTTQVGNLVTIVPRAHANQAITGSQANRFRNFLFAMRGVSGRTVSFALPFQSTGVGGAEYIHALDQFSAQNIKPVWSYDRLIWHQFDNYARVTTGTNTTWKVTASNNTPFSSDVIWVSINEHYKVGDFYNWLKTSVFTHSMVSPTASVNTTGVTNPTGFEIGLQVGATSTTAFSRTVPSTPLYAFKIKDPAYQPKRVCVLVSGQHPYEGQNKWALKGALQFILSSDPKAIAIRQNYVILVYPFVNPTGELAGLWRGTAANVTADTNRNWHNNAKAVDTINIHRSAMKGDIIALGLGVPTMLFDFHQTFESTTGHVVRNNDTTKTLTAGYLAALRVYHPATGDNLGATASADYDYLRLWSRNVLGSKGSVTCERGVYGTASTELAYGADVVRALADYTAAGGFAAVDNEIIVDNNYGYGVVKTGTWSNSTSISGYQGINYLSDGNASKGSKSVRFTPTIVNPGNYYVYVRWPGSSSTTTTLANNVPVDVKFSASQPADLVQVNESASGGAWTLLRPTPYTFAAGTAGYVQVSNTGTTATVAADAIRLVWAGAATPAEVIVDNASGTGVTITGSWTTSTTLAGYYGTNYLHDGNTGKGTKSVRYTPNIPATGSYQVYGRWLSASDRASNVPFIITHASGTVTVPKDQRSNSATWVLLGTYTFNAGTGGNVLISNTGTSGYVIADAVRFLQQ
jgi:hypothetical protein